MSWRKDGGGGKRSVNELAGDPRGWWLWGSRRALEPRFSMIPGWIPDRTVTASSSSLSLRELSEV